MSVSAQLAQGSKISISTDSGSTWTQIKEVKGITPGGASSSQIDVTDLDSLAKEYRTGLVDHGTLSFEVNLLETDPGQIACLAAFDAASAVKFQVETSTKTRTFDGSLTKWPTVPNLSVDGVQVGSAEVKISGGIIVADV